MQLKGLILTFHVITQNVNEICTQELTFNINTFLWLHKGYT